MTKAVSGTSFPAANLPKLIAAAKANTAAAYEKAPGISAPVMAAAQGAVKLAYVHAFRVVYLVAIAVGVLAIVCAYFTLSTDMAMKTDERAVILKNDPDAEVVYGEKVV